LVDEKTKQLKDSERFATIGQTAGMVGHDIRNPLQSIEGAVYLAKEEIKSLPSQSPEQRELEEIFHIIENQTRYIDHIVADLQDFARTPMPQPAETNLGALVNDALTTARIPKNIQVQTTFQENLKITIDPVFMMRVMANLIDNAVQAMPNGGKLNLTLTSDENKTSISVEDTGIGISEDDKPKIYTPLFTTKAKGQGFGLAVCKKLIEAQGGNISFTSEAGKGTSFTVTFPNKKTS
jgi:signal transduction histidine kinase